MVKSQACHKIMKLKYLAFAAVSILFSCGGENSATQNVTKASTEEASQGEDAHSSVNLDALLECVSSATLEKSVFSCLDGVEMNNLRPEQVDSLAYYAILRMEELCLEVEYDYDEAVDTETGEVNYELFNPFLSQGYRLDSEEGFYFLMVDYVAVFKMFGPYASEQMRSFLEYRSKNYQKIAYDASLDIEPMELARRLCDAEAIIKNGNSFTRELLKDGFIYELSWVYLGLDNTPAFDWETHDYLPEFSQTLNYLIKNGGTVIKHFTKTMEMEMEKSHNKYSEDLNEWINYETVRRKTEATYPTI